MKKKILLFGGTFDPVHNGHIAVAQAAMKELCADSLIFIPARRSPHKLTSPTATDQQRFEMIRLAVEGYEKIQVSDCEFYRSEPSYTIDTVRHFKKQFAGKAELYWLVGADTVKDLCNWYKISELIDECCLSVLRRGGIEPDFSGFADVAGQAGVEKLKNNTLSTPLIEVSSTEIRRRIENCEDFSGLLAPKVVEFINKNGIYRN